MKNILQKNKTQIPCYEENYRGLSLIKTKHIKSSLSLKNEIFIIFCL